MPTPQTPFGVEHQAQTEKKRHPRGHAHTSDALRRRTHPMFGEDWYYAITGDEAESMDEHVERGRRVIGAALNKLRAVGLEFSGIDTRIQESEQGSADQPATAAESKPEDDQIPKPEPEGRSR